MIVKKIRCFNKIEYVQLYVFGTEKALKSKNI